MQALVTDPAQALPWREWYGLQRWKKRRNHQLKTEPLCRLCLDRGHVTPAAIADHVTPHKGDWNQFRLGELQSLCADCHKGKWATDRQGFRNDIGDDGWPTDPQHPANSRESGVGRPSSPPVDPYSRERGGLDRGPPRRAPPPAPGGGRAENNDASRRRRGVARVLAPEGFAGVKRKTGFARAEGGRRALTPDELTELWRPFPAFIGPSMPPMIAWQKRGAPLPWFCAGSTAREPPGLLKNARGWPADDAGLGPVAARSGGRG